MDSVGSLRRGSVVAGTDAAMFTRRGSIAPAALDTTADPMNKALSPAMARRGSVVAVVNNGIVENNDRELSRLRGDLQNLGTQLVRVEKLAADRAARLELEEKTQRGAAPLWFLVVLTWVPSRSFELSRST